MKDFNEYLISWFRELLEQHDGDSDFMFSLFDIITDREEGESADKYLEKTVEEYLKCCNDAEILYEKLFEQPIDGIESKESFLSGCFMNAINDSEPFSGTSYLSDFVDNMAYHACNYDSPLGFFMDLANGGCVNGMIGMLYYHEDCKCIYCNNIDDMEYTKEYFEGEMGEPIRNNRKLPHYTFVCWLCYEELGHTIARNLFPETF